MTQCFAAMRNIDIFDREMKLFCVEVHATNKPKDVTDWEKLFAYP